MLELCSSNILAGVLWTISTSPKLTEYIGAQHWGTWTSDRPIHVLKGTITNGKGEHQFEVKPTEYCNEVIQNLAFSLHHEPEHVKMMN